MQYVDAIRMTADEREIKMVEKTVDLLYESSQYFKAGIQIERSMKQAKLKLIRLVFGDFEKEMEPLAAKYGLEPEKDTGYIPIRILIMKDFMIVTVHIQD